MRNDENNILLVLKFHENQPIKIEFITKVGCILLYLYEAISMGLIYDIKWVFPQFSAALPDQVVFMYKYIYIFSLAR
jgi:hypothetical protein